MITCPRCGAENKDDATACRMCATPLDGAAASTFVMPTPAPSGKVVCPSCQATNDSDWAFCQQCGSRLSTAAAPAASPSTWVAPTVVTPPAEPPPPAQQWGAPTVITPSPDFGNPPVAQPPAWGAATVVTPASPVQPPPTQQPAWGAPTVITPAPDFGAMAGGQAPPAPPAWGAPTVVTPIQDIPATAYPPTVVTPSTGGPAIPETIVTPIVPGEAPVFPPTIPAADDARTANVPRASGTADMSGRGGAPAPQQPPGGQSTIVMSSTPVATPPKAARLLLIMEGGEVGETFGVRPQETVIGRVDGDIKFPHDGYMSSRHARILQRNGRFFLIDNNSRNGTFVKIHQEVELHPGDVILIGKQLFRFEFEE